jgi:hypothetical protein
MRAQIFLRSEGLGIGVGTSCPSSITLRTSRLPALYCSLLCSSGTRCNTHAWCSSADPPPTRFQVSMQERCSAELGSDVLIV